MANALAKVPVKTLVQNDKVKQMLQNTLKGKATQFATSLVSVVNENKSLQDVDQMSVINSAMVAATLDLPINQNLGYMWLVPYKGTATPQIGYKGYIQLAQRTGRYKSMNAISVYEGQVKSWNPLTEEVVYDPNGKTSDEVVGYIGYFKLLNGFEKTVYWTKDEINEHRMRFSKMSGKEKPSGVWASDFDAMALKTVLRNLLSKWGPMSTEMEEAMAKDEQAPVESSVDEESPDDTASETTESLLNDFAKAQENEKRKSIDGKEKDVDDQGSNSKATENSNDTRASQEDGADQGQLL